MSDVGPGTNIRNSKIPVGPNGFVMFVDVMGDDGAIVDAARLSYHLENHASGNKLKRSDRDLLRYLMRNQHMTPFEMVELKFHVRCPMDVWRQWIRHRTANVNEYSTRYSIAIDSAMITGDNDWRYQGGRTKRQGSDSDDDTLPDTVGKRLTQEERELQLYARRVYQNRIDEGVAREQARKDLPLSTYTESIWKCDLRNTFNFLRLRLDSHAQKEIREFAQAISVFVRQLCPVAYKAFEEYMTNQLAFSNTEAELLQLINVDMDKPDADPALVGMTINDRLGRSERVELMAKLRRILPSRAVGVVQAAVNREATRARGDNKGA